MKIKLTNVQAFETAEFDFPAGITLVTGPTNSGKSALFRGLHSALMNPQGTAYLIHEDHKKATVEISDEFFGDFTWERAGSVTYTKGDQTFTKASTISVFDVIDKPPFVLFEDEIINIHGEYDKLFPFRYSPQKLFTLFEDFIGGSKTNEVISDITKDVQGFTKDINLLEDELNKTEGKLKLTEEINLSQHDDYLSVLIQSYDDLEMINVLLNQDKKLADELFGKAEQLDLVATVLIPEFSQIEYNRFTEFKADHIVFNNKVDTLRRIKDTVKLEQEFDFEFINDYNSLVTDQQSLYRLGNVADLIMPENYVFDFEMIDSFNGWTTELNSLIVHSQNIEAADKEIDSCAANLITLTENLKSLDICPLCGGEFDHEHGLVGLN